MTLHYIDSTPLAALGLVATSYLQGALWEMGLVPDEQMQLAQHADWPSTLILMKQGNRRAILELDLSAAPLVVDNTASGLGGIDTGVVGADTVYDLRVVADNSGLLAGVIATVSGDAPTIPAGYPWVSPVIGAMVTDATSDNYVLHNPRARVFVYDEVHRPLANGVQTAITAVALAAFVPELKCRLTAFHVSPNTSGNPSVLNFYYRNAANAELFEDNNVGRQAVDYAKNTSASALVWNVVTDDPNEMLWYGWSLAPASGANVYLIGFELPVV